MQPEKIKLQRLEEEKSYQIFGLEGIWETAIHIYFIKWQLLKMYVIVTCIYWHAVYMTSLPYNYFIIAELLYKPDFQQAEQCYKVIL